MKSKWDVSWTPFEHSLDEAFGLIGTRVSSHGCELKRVGFSAERYRPCSISIAFRLCLCSGSDLDPVRNLRCFLFLFLFRFILSVGSLFINCDARYAPLSTLQKASLGRKIHWFGSPGGDIYMNRIAIVCKTPSRYRALSVEPTWPGCGSCSVLLDSGDSARGGDP